MLAGVGAEKGNLGIIRGYLWLTKEAIFLQSYLIVKAEL